MAKKAVLIGCNYPGTRDELRGCINDVERVKRCLIDRYRFLEENITVMIDTDPSFTQPTGKNIRLVLSKLVKSAKPGDVLFVHFSGHGTRLSTKYGFHECIVPADCNLITDDDFRDLVDRVPRGCSIQIVSDSCHSGGLIKDVKEQIGDSTKKRRSLFGFLFNIFISIPKEKICKFFQFRPKPIEPHGMNGVYSYVKNRSLPVSTLIDILKQKTGKDDIDEGNLIQTLVDMFGEDASPGVKNFIKFGLDGLQHGGGESGVHGGILVMADKQEAYARSTKSSFPDSGILFSACQSDQGAAEARLSGNPDEVYGVFSNAIQAIIEDTNGAVTNRELVLKARKMLESQFFTQKPGLYCSDHHVDASFVC